MAYIPFTAFCTAHIIVLILTVFIAYGMVKFFRSDASETAKKRVRYTFAFLLIFTVFMDLVLPFLRYETDSAWNVMWDSSLPLYLCDVVALFLAYALITKKQRIAEIGYLWGMGGTLQGLITPTLSFGWDTLDFYNFFLEHSGVPIAAVALVWGMGIVPEKGAFKRAMLWSWGYMAIVMSLNWMMGKNYGFLNGKPDVDGTTLFDYMGPEPWYLLTLQGVAFTLYFLLLKIAPKLKTGSSELGANTSNLKI